MYKKLLTLTVLGLLAVATEAQPYTDLRPNETVLLYAEELTHTIDIVRGEKITPAGFEMVTDNHVTGDERVVLEGTDCGDIYNIGTDARFDLYFPEKPNGQMLVVCPGGGYEYVASYNEGVYVAEWMIEHGITVAIMKYRMPNEHRYSGVSLEDVQNTFRYCRAHAEEWGVKNIGVMGFSAGGHLAASASMLYADAVTRPDFSIYIYSVTTMDDTISHTGTHKYLIGFKEMATEREGISWEEWDAKREEYQRLMEMYSLENQTTPDSPPAFFAHCTNDGVSPENAIRLYTALRRNGVPVELHIFADGGHGWGFSSERYKGKGNDRFALSREEFNTALYRWIMSQNHE